VPFAVAERTGQESLNTRDLEQVDQALFGYSEGHRQIAASIRLPSKDMYNLAAASDLASGAKLGPEDSYLTGLPLAESRRFALIRTWPAPEMPRPGCVWSHVVLIDFRLLSSHGDLSDFLGLLKRPSEVGPKFYSEPISVGSSHSLHSTPDREIVVELIRTYYSGEPVLLDYGVDQAALEAAIMAVWSQQWPRLRTSFSFRTAAGGERRKSELVDYDVQVGSGVGHSADQDDGSAADDRRDWVAAGAADAATSRVTPLRRFLWRYGRDLLTPRKHYRTLVELFLQTENRSEVSAEEAIRIFDAIPEAADGDILKRDVLGMGSASPALCPPVALIGLLQLLASHNLGMIVTEDEVRKRFASVPAEQVGALATYADRYESALTRWKTVIDEGLVASVDRKALVGELPGRIRKLILMSRADLIDRDTVAALPDDGLLELASLHRGDEIGRKLAFAIVRRDFGASNYQLFKSMPVTIFEAAVLAVRLKEIHPAWMPVIAKNSSDILATDWLEGFRSTADLAIAVYLLRFPSNVKYFPQDWVAVLSLMRDDALGEDRTNLQAFLLGVAFQKMSSASWALVATVLPELRPVILQGALPSPSYQMLVHGLPTFHTAAYWDINKRILLGLALLMKSFPEDHGALSALQLSPKEMETVIYGAEQEDERSKSHFWPWF